MFSFFREFKGLLSVMFLLICASCISTSNHGEDPKGRLTDYISKSFSVKNMSDRAVLAQYLVGDVKARLEGWSEEQFKDAFINTKRDFIKLSFKDTKIISPSEVQITYELSYFDSGKSRNGFSNEAATVTNKKLCQMVAENGKWYISDVRNIKELIEYKNELSLP
jgi:hypothetical protein